MIPLKKFIGAGTLLLLLASCVPPESSQTSGASDVELVLSREARVVLVVRNELGTCNVINATLKNTAKKNLSHIQVNISAVANGSQTVSSMGLVFAPTVSGGTSGPVNGWGNSRSPGSCSNLTFMGSYSYQRI